MGWIQTCNTIQQIFETWNIPEEMTWAILVLTPKTSGGTRGIGLLEIMWKVCSSINNNRLHESHQGANPDRFHFCTHKLQMFWWNFPMEMLFSKFFTKNQIWYKIFRKSIQMWNFEYGIFILSFKHKFTYWVHFSGTSFLCRQFPLHVISHTDECWTVLDHPESSCSWQSRYM
jgi:hypothetical protein